MFFVFCVWRIGLKVCVIIVFIVVFINFVVWELLGKLYLLWGGVKGEDEGFESLGICVVIGEVWVGKEDMENLFFNDWFIVVLFF